MSESPDLSQFDLKEYKGTYVFVGTEIKDFPSFKCRDDDVWVCSFPRSGTTLTQQITYLIMTLDFEKGRTVDLDDRFPFADCLAESYPYFRGLQYLNGLPRDEPRLIKSHLHKFLLPNELKKGKGKIIYLTRNPKSSVCSLYKFLKYKLADPGPSMTAFIEKFLAEKDIMYCPWGLHVRQYWEKRNDENVFFLQFEKLIQDRRGTIKKIADFLGRNLTEEQIDRVLEETKLQSMKSNRSCNHTVYEDRFIKGKDVGAFINTGKINGWKDEMPDDLVRQMDEMIKRELGHTDIQYWTDVMEDTGEKTTETSKATQRKFKSDSPFYYHIFKIITQAN